MTPFIVLVASVAAAATAGTVGSKTGSKRLERLMGGVLACAVLVALACVAIGLWQAWSPWELKLERR